MPLVKNPPAMQDSLVWFLGLEELLEKGIGYPLQYSWASLEAQLVKNPSAMRETWVGSPGWEDPLEKGKATHSSILAWRIPYTWGSKELDTTERLSFHFMFKNKQTKAKTSEKRTFSLPLGWWGVGRTSKFLPTSLCSPLSLSVVVEIHLKGPMWEQPLRPQGSLWLCLSLCEWTKSPLVPHRERRGPWAGSAIHPGSAFCSA